MAKDQSTKVEAPAEQAATEQAAVLTLNEFCIRLSAKDKRVELIGAFEFTERQAKRLKATEKEFSERYQAFLKQPA